VSSSTLEFKAGQEKSIVTDLKKIFSDVSETSKLEQKILSRLEIKKEGKTVFVILYSTGKCLIQGADGQLFDLIKKTVIGFGLSELKTEKPPVKYIAELDENNFYKEKNFIVGFDEAGIGEVIGSAVFAAVILPKESLSLFEKLRKDIKSLSYSELNYYWDLVRTKFINLL